MLKILKNKVFVGVFVLALVVVGFTSHKAEAATCTATAGGDWNTAGTWTDCGHIPTSSDAAVIPSGQAVTIAATPTTSVGSITINNAGATTGLTMSGAGTTLTVTGAVTLAVPSSAGTSTLAVGASTLSAGSISLTGGTSEIVAVTASTGTITTAGGITFAGTAASDQLTTTGAGAINLTGTISSGGTLSINAGTLLTSTGTSAINGAYTLGKVEVSSGTLTLGAAQSVTGLQVDNGATLAGSTFLLTDTGTGTGTSGFNINGTYSGSGGVTLNGIGATMDGVGTVSNTGTLTLTGAKTIASTASLTVAGTTALSASTVITNNGTFTTTAAGGITGTDGTSNWTNGANSSLYFGGATTSLLSTGVLTASAAGNLVNYNLGGAQTVKIPASSTYYNLSLSGSGLKTIGAAVTVSNNLVVASGVTMALTGASTTLRFEEAGVFQNAGSWGFTGSGATNINTTFFPSGSGTLTVTSSNKGGITSLTCSYPATLVGGSCVLPTSTTTGGGTTATTITTTPTTAVVTCPTGAMFDTTTGAKCTVSVSVTSVTCPTGAMFDTASGQKCTAWMAPATPTPFNQTIAFAMGTTTVKLGTKGNSCKVWQMFLNGHGYKLTADGDCGKLTIAAAKTWQASAGLKADGILGAMSRAKATEESNMTIGN